MPRYSVKLKRTSDSFIHEYEVDAVDQAAAETVANAMAVAGGGAFDAPEVAAMGAGGLTQVIADTLYEPIGSVVAHEAALDPHPAYTTVPECDILYEPADAAIQTHITAVHAPSNAQKNSDITKGEIEAKLTGEISSHTHAGGGGGASLTRISGSSGAAGADFTFQRLSANATANSTTTPTTVMTTTGLGAGTWAFKYLVRYQSSAATTGVGFCVNHTGTTGAFLSTWSMTTTGGAAATGVADQVTSTNAGQLVEGKSERVKNTVSSASAGVDTINADCLAILEGLVVVTVSGSLELKHSSETAASTQVMADTLLELRKIA